jgi:hypothetical protein
MELMLGMGHTTREGRNDPDHQRRTNPLPLKDLYPRSRGMRREPDTRRARINMKLTGTERIFQLPGRSRVRREMGREKGANGRLDSRLPKT